MANKSKKWSNIYLIFVFILMYAPIFYLIFYSFNKGDFMADFSGFSWRHYIDMFADTRLMQILVNTFIVALFSSLFASLVHLFGVLCLYFTKLQHIKNFLLLLN